MHFFRDLEKGGLQTVLGYHVKIPLIAILSIIESKKVSFLAFVNTALQFSAFGGTSDGLY